MSERQTKRRHRKGKASMSHGQAPTAPAISSDDAARAPPSPTGESRDNGPSRCLDAFVTALNETHKGQGWFGSTKNLQLTSLQFCVACRDVATWHVRVKAGAPRRLWAAAAETEGHCSGRHVRPSPRVPALRARGITWDLSASPQPLFESPELAGELQFFVFGHEFNNSNAVRALKYPKRLERLVFGHDFDQPVDGVSWPASSLLQLTFGWNFNQAINRVAWPASLQQLTFGCMFDQPIDDVAWPASLRDLALGGDFNQNIDKVVWPVSLRSLTFGVCFDQAVDKVVWPVSLKQLTFGYYFDQPIDNVAWPDSLRRLTFGACFDWVIEDVVWPTSLENLAFGFEFNQTIENVVWPGSLQHLTFGACFDQALEKVVWPASLQYLTLGCVFNHPLQGVKRWPSALAELTLLFYPSRNYAHSLVGIAWPTGLKRLTVGCRLGSETFALPRGVEIRNYCQYADCYSEGAFHCWYHNGLL